MLNSLNDRLNQLDKNKKTKEINDSAGYFQLTWRMTLRYLILYLIFGSLWIVFSDMIMYSLISSRQLLNNLSIAKGWFFMIVSSFMFFLMLRRRQKLWSEALNQLELRQKTLFDQQKVLEESNKKIIEADLLIEKQLYFDHLTHLPNKVYLEKEFAKHLNSSSFGLIYIDLDDFRYVNDRYGYEAGNHILKLVAEVLRRNLRESDLAVRLGADEFAILVDPMEDVEAMNACISRLQQELKKPWHLEDRTIYISISAGAAIYPQHGKTFDQIFQSAELAMMSCKDSGKDAYCLFVSDIREKAVKHADTLTQLKIAIENQEFIVHYQPQIFLKDGSVRGVEALVRWQHPERGLIMPGEFIGLAEETGLIMPIGSFVMEEVERQKKIWLDKGICPGILSVNLSSRRFRQGDLIESMKHILDNQDIQCGRLEIEITETAMLERPESAIEIINKMRQHGVSFALDDFGSGYASLNYLRKLPIDVLKIDFDFINNMLKSDHDAIIVKTMIDLAHGLGMQVIAEGIEEAEQLQFLKQLGCDIGQGYYFSRPISAEKVEPLLKNGYIKKQF